MCVLLVELACNETSKVIGNDLLKITQDISIQRWHSACVHLWMSIRKQRHNFTFWQPQETSNQKFSGRDPAASLNWFDICCGWRKVRFHHGLQKSTLPHELPLRKNNFYLPNSLKIWKWHAKKPTTRCKPARQNKRAEAECECERQTGDNESAVCFMFLVLLFMYIANYVCVCV